MSRVFNQCPKCSVDLADGASSCACGWRKRDAKTERLPQGPSTCCWNDYGDTCGDRGILSQGTNGGPWYCREHFYRLMRWTGMEGKHGNQLPEAHGSSKAVDDVRANLKLRAGKPLAKFLPRAEDDERTVV